MLNLIETIRQTGDLEEVREHLTQLHNSQLELDEALFIACRMGYVSIAQLLLDSGAHSNYEHGLCLSAAIEHNYWAVVELLWTWETVIFYNSDLERIFNYFLTNQDVEQIFKTKWPNWLYQKYDSQIQKLNQKIVD